MPAPTAHALTVYAELARRGLTLGIGPNGRLTAGPKAFLTDQVRATITTNQDALLEAVREQESWVREPYSHERAQALLSAVLREIGRADPRVYQPVEADAMLHRAKYDLVGDERQLAHLVGRYRKLGEQVDALSAADQEAEARTLFHGDYWTTGDAFSRFLNERFDGLMPPAVAVLCGWDAEWVEAENDLDRACRDGRMDLLYAACVRLRVIVHARRGDPVPQATPAAVTADEEEW